MALSKGKKSALVITLGLLVLVVFIYFVPRMGRVVSTGLDSKVRSEVSSQLDAKDIPAMVNNGITAANIDSLVTTKVASKVKSEVNSQITALDVPGQIRTEVADAGSTQVEAGLKTFNESLPAKIAEVGDARYISINGPTHKGILAQIEKNSAAVTHLDTSMAEAATGINGNSDRIGAVEIQVEANTAAVKWLEVKTDAVTAAGHLSKTNKSVKEQDTARRQAIFEAFVSAAGYNADGTILDTAPADSSTAPTS